jgi:hypothetical protein
MRRGALAMGRGAMDFDLRFQLAERLLGVGVTDVAMVDRFEALCHGVGKRFGMDHSQAGAFIGGVRAGIRASGDKFASGTVRVTNLMVLPSYAETKNAVEIHGAKVTQRGSGSL